MTDLGAVDLGAQEEMTVAQVRALVARLRRRLVEVTGAAEAGAHVQVQP